MNEPNGVKCGLCHTFVPARAEICTGCHARVRYGPPPLLNLIWIGASVVVGMYLARNGGNVVGWGVGIVMYILGALVLLRKFKDHVTFIRKDPGAP